ncbi:carboxypeptidase-like regulatory domain-containing protein [Glaciecola sp. 1036]|uniref:carboxypeptidase-like regulatory domain-containing protein n=1 Tax=Alteromonadaceae TaxID=72275 RepID=UPI003D029E77
MQNNTKNVAYIIKQTIVSLSIALCIALPVYSQSPSEAQGSALRYADGEELLFSLIADKYLYGEVYTIVKDNHYYILLDDFTNSAGFAIKNLSTSASVEYAGWWATQDNTFSLKASPDITNIQSYPAGAIAFVDVNGNAGFLTEQDLIIQGDELFVRSDVLAEWFKASFTFDEERLELLSKNEVLWPFQQAKKRKATKLYSSNRVGDAKEQHHDFGYALRSPQTMDLVTTVQGRRVESEDRDFNAGYNLLGRQDLLGLSAGFYFAGNDDDIVNQGTLDFNKYWLDGNSGPLGMTNLNFGDIQPVRVGRESSSLSRGVAISNKPLNNETLQEQANITGLVQAGWDVELYQNGILVAQAFDQQSGRYEFLDIPLYSGLNEFEIVKYGPQGQVERETQEKVLSASFSDSFTPFYEISISQNNETLFNFQDVSELAVQDYALNGRYDMAIADNFSVNLGHSLRFGSEAIDNTYTAGFAYRPFERLMLNFDYRYLENNSHSMEFAARTAFWGQTMAARLGVIKDTTESRNEDVGYNSSFSISGSLLTSEWLKIFQQTDLRYSKNLTGTQAIAAVNRLSLQFKKVSLNHSLSYQNTEDEFGNTEDRTIGNLSLVSPIGRVFTRAGIAYSKEVDESFDIDSAFIATNWYAFNKVSLRAEIAHSFAVENTRYSLGVDWKSDLYALNARIEHSDLFDTSIMLSARISMSEAPTEFGYIQDRLSLANTGTILVRVYHDVNNNRVYDADDIALPEVKVEAPQARKVADTDVIGIAQLDNLRNFNKTDIKLDRTTISDPLLIQSTIDTSVTPRPGLVALVNYPLLEGGEIEGEVSYVDQYGRVQLVPNVPIEIRDAKGKIVYRIKSGFDGYYYFFGLLPHNYSLTINKDFLLENAFTDFEPMALNVAEQGMQFFDFNIKLNKKQSMEGYVVHSGKFETATYLNLYYEVVSNKLSALNQNISVSPFQHKFNDNTLTLGLSFVSDKQDADFLCEQLKQILSDCQISSHTVYFANNK